MDCKNRRDMHKLIQNLLQSLVRLPALNRQKTSISYLNDINGVIKPARMTLLLGPPGCGKSTFLRALSGRLDKSLKVNGEISCNGYRLDVFVPEKTSAYISQHDLHIPEMTVREILDFSARCQGVGSQSGRLKSSSLESNYGTKRRWRRELVVEASAETRAAGRFYLNFTGLPFPLGPFLNRRTVRTEAVKDCIWLFEQEQALGFSNVSTNICMTVVKLKSGTDCPNQGV